MEFEWDVSKNKTNLAKHGIEFGEACLIFQGPVYTVDDDREDYGELRSRSIGKIGEAVAVLVVHTEREGRIRIISARLANRRERKVYEEHFGQTPR